MLKSVPQVLVVIDVAQLVAHDSRIASHSVDVRMRMAVDPHINATVSNEITEFRGESPIQHRAFVLSGHHRQRWQMMRDHNDVLGRTLLDSLLQELETFLVLQIEVIGREAMSIIHNLSEVVHSPMHMKHVHLGNPRLQRCQYIICVIDADYLVVIIAHILAKYPLPTVATRGHIAVAIKLVIPWHQ